MRLAQAKKIVLPLVGALVILVSALMPFGRVQAAVCTDVSRCRPYLKALGADVMAGGWFDKGAACTPVSGNSQDPFYSDAKSWYGGIQTYAKKTDPLSGINAPRGASSQYAAFSLGQIDGAAAPGGFYSAGSPARSPITKLSFANDSTFGGIWGGKFQGATPQRHCIPNYYDDNLARLSTGTIYSLGENSFGSESDSLGGGPAVFKAQKPMSSVFHLFDARATTIHAGANITVLIDGNVYIKNDIVYEAGDADHVPKFTLIVQGNIFIDPSVSRLDGLYITEPHNADQASSVTPGTLIDDGVIWTCHDATTNPIDLAYPAQGLCRTNKLTINGAVIAKQIHWLRTNGDLAVAPSSGAEDGVFTNATSSSNVAEVVNYTPQMVIGGRFFNLSGAPLNIQSLIYLPPVF